MSWSEIKHAINSTLGTSEFQSLDKMINGAKGLVASDKLYVPILGTETMIGTIANGSSIMLPYRITCKLKGSIRVVIDVKTGYSNYINKGTFYYYVNGTEYSSQSWDDSDNTGSGATHSCIVTKDIILNKNDVVTIGWYKPTLNYSGAYLNAVNVCADLIDTSGIVFEEVQE